MPKRVIVIHTAECGESANADKGIENTLKSRRIPVTRIFDADSEIQMLDIRAACGAARGLPKADGVHYEHAGFARQTPDEWADPYSEAMLRRSAARAAQDAAELGIPAVHLTPAQVRAGGRGFCGHIDVTNAYQVRGGHWDPGPNFPWDHYLDMVRSHMGEASQAEPPVIPQEDDMPAAVHNIFIAETLGIFREVNGNFTGISLDDLKWLRQFYKTQPALELVEHPIAPDQLKALMG